MRYEHKLPDGYQGEEIDRGPGSRWVRVRFPLEAPGEYLSEDLWIKVGDLAALEGVVDNVPFLVPYVARGDRVRFEWDGGREWRVFVTDLEEPHLSVRSWADLEAEAAGLAPPPKED